MFGKILKTPEASLAFRMMNIAQKKQTAAPQHNKRKRKNAASLRGVRANAATSEVY